MRMFNKLPLVLCTFIVINCLQVSSATHTESPGKWYYTFKAGAHVSGILFTMACGFVGRKTGNVDEGKLIALCAALPHAAGIAAPYVRNCLQKKKNKQPKVRVTSKDSSWWLGVTAHLGAALFHCLGGGHCFTAGKKIYHVSNGYDPVGYSFKSVQSLIPGLLYHAIGFALGEFAQCAMQDCNHMNVRVALRGANQTKTCEYNLCDACKRWSYRQPVK